MIPCTVDATSKPEIGRMDLFCEGEDYSGSEQELLEIVH